MREATDRDWGCFFVTLIILILLSAFLFGYGVGRTSGAEAAGINWRSDYDSAVAESRRTGKRLFVYFTADNCSWCARMEQTTFRDAEVIESLNARLIPVKLHARTEADRVRQFRVSSFPATIIAGPDGVIQHRLIGYQSADALKGYLR